MAGKTIKERGLAKEGELNPGKGEVALEVVTRLERRIRAGITVTQVPQTVVVSEADAALIEADAHITATRE